MAKRGRPKESVKQRLAKITVDYELVERLALLGSSDAQMASVLGVNEVTINRWKTEDEEFLKALKRGKEEADARVGESLYQRALGYTHDAVKIMQHRGKPVIVPYQKHYPPDPVSAIFWLKNRHPDKWRDRPANDNADDSQVAELLAKLNAMVQDSPEEYSGPEEDEDE